MSAVQPMRSERAWTEEQERAIDRRQGDLLLDASAGSGKTSVLVERFVAAVLQDGIDVTAMLTITFTEKAAAELRDRIRARLHELGAADEARRTEGAFISTIHGFCGRVLRANALTAGLDPHFSVLDRTESEPMAAAAFDDALEDLAHQGDRAVDLVAAYGAFALRAAIVGVYGQLRSSGALHPRLPGCPPDRLAEAAAELRRAAAVVAAELGEIAAPGKSVLEAVDRVGHCLELVARAGSGAAGGDRIEALWPPDLEALRLPRNGAALSTDGCVAYTAALADFRAQVAARAAVPVRDLLDRLLDAFGRNYEKRKRAASGLDFEDLELATRRLLADDGELRGRYSTRFDRIMVDELQDTNRVQLELIESIARDNLFTVGDAQQSIYGFRHADVELFERRGERLAAIGARQTLQTNFRSRPQIIEALNLAFAGELGDRFKPLRAGRGEEPGADPAVELLLVDKAADWEQEGVASPWRVAEARLLADRVGQLVDEGWAPGEIVVLMRATTDMRAYERALERHGLPTYVIGGRGYWSHPQVVDLLAYLRALANPRDEESVYGVLASPLVGVSLDALVILAAAARDRVRDPWWILRESLDALEGLTDGDRSKLAGFAGWFAAERRRAARCGPEELIDSALVASGYDLAMLAMPGGRRRLANVRKLMRLGREHEDAHGPDLHRFLAVLADRQAGRSAESRESEAPVEGEGLDAIRLMTIHRAKGLEFKLVVVADLGRSVRPAAEILRVTGDGEIGLRLARAGVAGREPAFDYRAIGDRRRAAEEAEERRLFYVAMTRARERLVLSGALKFAGFTAEGGPTGGGPAAWIAPAFVPELGRVLEQGGGEVQRDGVRIAVRVARPEDQAGGDAGEEAPGSSPMPAVPAPPVAPLESRNPAPPVAPLESTNPAPPVAPPAAADCTPPVPTLSYSSLQEYHRCGYRFYAERVLGLPPVAEPGPRAGEDITGPRSAADRGVLLHALLERLDFRRPVVPSAEAVRAAATRMGLWPPPGPAEADELAALVRGFAESELCARLARATSTRREERFAFSVGGDPGAPLVIGAIDVLVRERHERVLIVDYKSDRLDGAAPEQVAGEQYATQRLVYALAALRAGAGAVEVIHCFIEQPEAPAGLMFARADRDDLERALADLSRGVLRREFPVTPTPHRHVCAGCPAEGGLCSWPLEMTRRESPDRLF
ncbi:MAG TPA: UvrD-helicase domain-containing protein [Solirubrobacteraceae bacterium]|nr:UvrD-helicase domain-containing protein [Solirubrobacteraceae bacterium]